MECPLQSQTNMKRVLVSIFIALSTGASADTGRQSSQAIASLSAAQKLELIQGRTVPGIDTNQIASTLKMAGGFSGGGGEILPTEYGSAWVQDEAAAKACILMDQNYNDNEYNTRPEDLKRDLQLIFNKWVRYVKDFHLDYNGPKFPKGLEFQSSCSSDTNIVFMFGVENQIINALRTKYGNPAAFGERISYDLNTQTGQGIIWVANSKKLDLRKAPNLNNRKVFFPLMLHELGRVFGNTYYPGTIMDANIVARLKVAEKYPGFLNALYSIDHEYSLTGSSNTTGAREKQNPYVVEKLLGSKAKEMLAGSKPEDMIIESVADISPGGSYRITNPVTKKSLKLLVSLVLIPGGNNPLPIAIRPPVPLFKRITVRGGTPEEYNYIFTPETSSVNLYSIKNADGKTLLFANTRGVDKSAEYCIRLLIYDPLHQQGGSACGEQFKSARDFHRSGEFFIDTDTNTIIPMSTH